MPRLSDITDIGSLETNYPSDMTLVSRGGADSDLFVHFKPLLSGQPVRFTRESLILEVRDMFPDGPTPDLAAADAAEHSARLCALTNWERVRPRRY